MDGADHSNQELQKFRIGGGWHDLVSHRVKRFELITCIHAKGKYFCSFFMLSLGGQSRCEYSYVHQCFHSNMVKGVLKDVLN